MNYQNVEFIKSAADPSGFIRDSLPQVVFAGKSNVGKSSVINRILNRKNFARVGNTPGKTIHVNYFKIDKRVYFVDLPGYGFAKVSAAEKGRWGRLMENFFSEGDRISVGVLIVDARHKPTPDDLLMAKWFAGTGRPFVIVANKADKLSKTALEESLEVIRASMPMDAAIRLLPFSAEKGTNRDALIVEIEKIV
jgi:GTP-binding protein